MTNDRPDTAPILPSCLIDEPDGSVTCVYDAWTEDVHYASDTAALIDHLCCIVEWDAIPRCSRESMGRGYGGATVEAAR